MGYATAALLGFVVLVAAPGATQPFTAPKLLVGTAGSAVIVLWAIATSRLRWRVPAGLAFALAAFAAVMGLAAAHGGAGSFSQFAFLLSGPIVLILILALDDSDLARPACGLVWAAAVVAAVAVVQRAGLDPWRLAGWAPSAEYASPRMRAYATLGNPNFVASVLAVSLPWAIVVFSGAGARVLVSAALVTGILATGSRVGLVAAGAGLASLAWASRPVVRLPAKSAGQERRGPTSAAKPALAILVLAVVVVLAAALSERAVMESIAGRLLPVRVAWPQAPHHPIFGLGLGAVARDYATWQAAFFADPTHASLARFAGDFDHLHNEPIEWLVETGLVGLAAWVAVVVLALRAGARRGEPPDARAHTMRTAALSALVAVAAVSLADFPLHRPADYLAVWLALAVAARPAPGRAEALRYGRGQHIVAACTRQS